MNLPWEVIEVYRGPAPEGYHYAQQLKRGDHIALEALPEIDLLVPMFYFQANERARTLA